MWVLKISFWGKFTRFHKRVSDAAWAVMDSVEVVRVCAILALERVRPPNLFKLGQGYITKCRLPVLIVVARVPKLTSVIHARNVRGWDYSSKRRL